MRQFRIARMCSALVLACVAGSQASALAPLDCAAVHNEGPELTWFLDNADIGGAELRLPRAYMQSPRMKSGQTSQTLFISVWKDSFLPYTYEDETSQEQLAAVVRGDLASIDILVGSYKPLDALLVTRTEDSYSTRGRSKVSVEGVAFANGLQGQPVAAKGIEQEIFHYRSPAGVTDLIRCDKIGVGKFPMCNHILEAGAYDINLTYYRKDLDRWREYRDRASELISCFTVRAPIQKEDR